MIPIAVLSRLPWKYIGAAVAVAGALYGAYSWAYGRGHDSRNGEVATLTQERDTARDNVATMEGAIAGQNKAIALAGEVTARAQGLAADAARGGRERDKAVAGMMGRLDGVRASDGRCVTPGPVNEAWEQM